MATRAQKVRLGSFMILAILAMVATVGTLAGLKLWNPKDRYIVRYKESVSGLEVGSAVKMKGVRVGRVDSVTVEDVETVRVDLSLDPGTPIKVDTQAVVTSRGLTGLNFIELTGGSAHSPRLAPNSARSVIQPGDSIVHTLTGKAIDISQKVEQVLNNLLPITGEDNRTKLRSLLTNTDKAMAGAAAILEQKQTRRIMKNIDRTTASLSQAAEKLQNLVTELAPHIQTTLVAASAAAESINRAAQKMRPSQALAEITQAARALRKRIEDPAITAVLDGLKATARTMRQVGTDIGGAVRRNDRQLARMLTLLTAASSYLKSFSRSINEHPSLLLRGTTVKERSVK